NTRIAWSASGHAQLVSESQVEGGRPMTSSFRIAVLAALTIFIVSSVPTTSVARGFPCENAQDCPGGDICVVKRGHKSGFCASPKAGLGPCVSPKDCPKGDICNIGAGQKSGTCVSARRVGPCEDARDCPKGDICNKKPGEKTGVCVSPKR